MMGWATGKNAAGRDVGYAVKATCDLNGCEREIDRGLAYVCGDMHDGGEYGCGGYFCGEHTFYSDAPEQLCGTCLAEWERAHEARHNPHPGKNVSWAAPKQPLLWRLDKSGTYGSRVVREPETRNE